jgi:hypothetical protein
MVTKHTVQLACEAFASRQDDGTMSITGRDSVRFLNFQ